MDMHANAILILNDTTPNSKIPHTVVRLYGYSGTCTVVPMPYGFGEQVPSTVLYLGTGSMIPSGRGIHSIYLGIILVHNTWYVP